MFGMMEALLSFIRRQVGLRTDAASAGGSLHGKVTELRNYVGTNLDKKISQSGIKSVQRGVVINYGVNNISISAVNTTKAFIVCHGTGSNDSAGRGGAVFAELTSSTNLKISPMWETTGGDIQYTGIVGVAWQVIEFY